MARVKRDRAIIYQEFGSIGANTMAIYICEQCQDYKDDDYDPCEDVNGENVCTDCAVELEEEEEAEHEQMD